VGNAQRDGAQREAAQRAVPAGAHHDRGGAAPCRFFGDGLGRNAKAH
jgi:hypothetical protein